MIIASGAHELFSFLAMAAVQPGVTHLQWATSGIMNELIRLIPDVVYETVYAIPIYLRAAVLSNTFFALSLLFSLAVVSAAYAQLTDCDPQDVTDHEI